MPLYQLKAVEARGEPLSLSTVIDVAKNAPGSPIAFGYLVPRAKEKEINLDTYGTACVKISGDEPLVVRGVGLASCAMVCFLKQGFDDLLGYFYHANAGTVPMEVVEKAKKFIVADGRGDDMSVVYAYGKPHDDGYEQHLNNLQRWLRKADIIGIANLQATTFGMNEKTELGY